MKRILTAVISLLLVLCSLCGCAFLPIPDLDLEPAVDVSTPFIGFRLEKPETADLEGYDRVEAEQLAVYEPTYSGYGVRVYYDTLTPQEQTLYRIFQYAMDHAQPCIFVDSRIVEDTENTVFEQVLYCLALDNPMLEQNLYWTSWGADITIPNPNPFSSEPDQRLTGKILLIPVFGQDIMDKKLLALEKAEQILSEMPQDLSDAEKAEYFYRYLGNHVEYFSAEDREELQNYLYDALVTGKTNCDGFANAFSLLCDLSQVTCVEKMYTPADPEEIGHTWNAVCIDEKWYNVDATASREVKEKYSTMRHFCFADKYLEYETDMAERVPVSEENLVGPDCTVKKASQAGKQVKSAWKTVKKTGRKYVVALFPGGEQKKSVMQKIANALNKNISTVHYVTPTGEAIYYIFPK